MFTKFAKYFRCSPVAIRHKRRRILKAKKSRKKVGRNVGEIDPRRSMWRIIEEFDAFHTRFKLLLLLMSNNNGFKQFKNNNFSYLNRVKWVK